MHLASRLNAPPITSERLPARVQRAGGLDEFIKATELEVGRYLNPRIFGSVVATPGIIASSSQGGRAPIDVSIAHCAAR